MRTRHYKTLDGLFRALGTDSRFHPHLDLSTFLSGRARLNGEFRNFTVSDELRDQILNLFASAIWERGAKSKAWKIERVKQCGILRGVMIEKGKDGYRAIYYAGQDYPSEIRYIQGLMNR